ncbi:hypothetical protein KP509_19G077300 [Ceratopteris richardii]|uniref:Uncharacterized protein n=1 Tax=Ceratopteris richardii TaxID=49495 RepID=A0A8T2SQD7_CERRI|nr:hypothetical protein KP509_19G077300 [Ceratopteris richardii]
MGTGANAIVAATARACTTITTQPLDIASTRMKMGSFGKSRAIASKAGQYAGLIPTLVGNATSRLFNKLLRTQSLVTLLLLISLSVSVFHAPICWMLVCKFGMGITGAVVAPLAIYDTFSPKYVQVRMPLSMETLQDLKPFLKLALPSVAMICLEWWSYEVLVILSGFLSNPEVQVAAISVFVNTEWLIYMISFGLNATASTRVQ